MFYKTIDTAQELKEEFRAYNRRDTFSYEAYEALFEMLNNMESYELDVIAICCDFNEATEDDIRADYAIDEDVDVGQYLQDNTIAMKLSNGDFLYQSF